MLCGTIQHLLTSCAWKYEEACTKCTSLSLSLSLQTRTPDIPNPDQLRPAAEAFLERSLASDVPLLYPPSQIALAALRHGCSHTKISIDGYILSVLFKSEDSEKADSIMDTLEKIEEMVLQTVLPDGESVGIYRFCWVNSVSIYCLLL
ncbi:Cyclin-H [Geodia barretti]|uniref:Cyclin-H n=1 Tax=Geodia barretti TaxID=519541 RepID=A0AA35T9S7_GEOBA|nr:Cyclin-H [Geodia barretti]